jgi:hypothetical protein
MVERLLTWLDGKASAYLVWRHEREWAEARAEDDECEDCRCPTRFCSCDSRDPQGNLGWLW